MIYTVEDSDYSGQRMADKRALITRIKLSTSVSLQPANGIPIAKQNTYSNKKIHFKEDYLLEAALQSLLNCSFGAVYTDRKLV